MRDDIEKRVISTAVHIIATQCTIREAAREAGVSKSTTHNDMRERLPELNFAKYTIVRAILYDHKRTCHIRGGEAIRRIWAQKNADRR